MFPCFFGGTRTLFVSKGLRALTKASSGLGGLYDVIQPTVPGRDIGVAELFPVVIDKLRVSLIRIF